MIVQWFEALPIVWTGVVVVGGFITVTLTLGYFVGRILPLVVREQHNDLAGFILAVVGVIYAVLLAFIAIGVWERFEQAEARTYDEATNLTIVYRDAGSFQNGARLRATLHDYVETVVKDEWPKMNHGERSLAARRMVESVDREVRDLPVTDARLQDIQTQMLSSMGQALADRDARLSMDATGINGIIWLVLFMGALITVGFTYLFGFKQTLVQQLMIGSLSLLIGLMLFLTIALDYPFRGGITVDPGAFENALLVFGTIGK